VREGWKRHPFAAAASAEVEKETADSLTAHNEI